MLFWMLSAIDAPFRGSSASPRLNAFTWYGRFSKLSVTSSPGISRNFSAAPERRVEAFDPGEIVVVGQDQELIPVLAVPGGDFERRGIAVAVQRVGVQVALEPAPGQWVLCRRPGGRECRQQHCGEKIEQGGSHHGSSRMIPQCGVKPESKAANAAKGDRTLGTLHCRSAMRYRLGMGPTSWKCLAAALCSLAAVQAAEYTPTLENLTIIMSLAS